MMKSNRKLWIILLPVLAVVIIITVIFWDAILIRIAPKVVLTTVLTDVFSQLDERFQDDPLLILLKSVDPEGKYTADIELTASNKLLGSVSYDMDLQTNGNAHQLHTEGTAVTSGSQLDFSLYADADFLAVSSNDLLSGTYYGITYDSFYEDIRSIPLLSLFISNKMLTQWNDSIQNVQDFMSQDYTIPQIPEVSKEDVHKLLLGILALPCEIENTSISADASFLNCYAISFHISGNYASMLPTNTSDENDATVIVTFYLYENTLLKVQVKCTSDKYSALYALDLGSNPAEDTICMEGITQNDATFHSFSLSVETQHPENQYHEIWNLTTNSNGITQATSLEYDYNLSTGVLNLTTNKANTPVKMYLSETENGIQIQTDHLESLIALFSEDAAETDSKDQISCLATIAKGSQITTPTYKNLDQWSLEDFWLLLSNLGVLVGIQIEA